MARANKRRKGTQIFDRRKVESERENEMVEKYLVVVEDEIQNDKFTHKPLNSLDDVESFIKKNSEELFDNPYSYDEELPVYVYELKRVATRKQVPPPIDFRNAKPSDYAWILSFMPKVRQENMGESLKIM